jgi:protein-disulfide isomerase
LAGIIVAVAVVALIIGGGAGYAIHGWIQPAGPEAPAATAGTDTGLEPPTVFPPNATADFSGIKVNPKAPANAPLLVIYQDYQCPYCAGFDKIFGPTIEAALAKNQIRVEYHTMNFLDAANDPNSATAGSSTRTAMAAACADAEGVFDIYHNLVYANQPAAEKDGFTDDLLRVQLPTQAGLSGSALTSFQKCYDNAEMYPFVRYTNAMAQAAGITGTPSYVLNGTRLNLDPNDGTSLQRALDEVL